MRSQSADPDFAKAVVTYLAFGMSRMTDYMSTLCVHDNTQERTVHVFGRQALPLVWDYSELNPISDAVGSWESMMLRRIPPVLAHLTRIPPVEDLPQVRQGSATELPYPHDFFDAVITDPPYYDNVPYSGSLGLLLRVAQAHRRRPPS
jgi:putative DNA methylase